MTHNITEQEIKEAVRWITSEPDNKSIDKIKNYFHNSPKKLEALERLKDNEFKESFIILLYNYNRMHNDLFDNIVENEGIGRIILEVLMKENGLNQEEINELLDRNCWRRATQFSVKNSRNFTDRWNYKEKRVNWKDKEERSLSVQEVLNVIENRAKVKTEEIEAKKQLTEQLALNQTIEEEVVEKFKEKYPKEIESFLLIKKEFESLKEQLEAAELDAKTHYDAIGVSEVWNKDKEKVLRKEIADKSELLETTQSELEEEKSKNKELQKQIEEYLETIRINHEDKEEQKQKYKELQYLSEKPLPKRPSKLKILREKIKSKFQKLQLLIKSRQLQEQEMVAKVEVRIK